MKIDVKYKEIEYLYEQGWRFNPLTKTVFLSDKSTERKNIPKEFNGWEIQYFNHSTYINERMKPILELTRQAMLDKRCQCDGLTIRLRDAFGNEKTTKLYVPNKNGDIIMTQFDLYRNRFYEMRFHNAEAIDQAQRENFSLIQYKYGLRLNPLYQTTLMPDSKYNFTYYIPKPFFDPELVNINEAKRRLKTVITTEGQYKSLVANRIGLPVISFPSITNWREKSTDAIFTDIIHFIQNTQAEQFILLWDGDCLRKTKNPKKPPHARPYLFYRMAYSILVQIKVFCPNIKLFFAYINTAGLKRQPKGLDDLILEYCTAEHLNKITDDLLTPNLNSNYFKIVNVTQHINETLKEIYNIDELNINDIVDIKKYFSRTINENKK